MHRGHHLASMASSVFSFLCLAFLLFSIWEVHVAEAILFERPSKTWAGPCQVMVTKKCDQQCREQEHALHGACHYRFPGFACFCYFKEKAEVQVQLDGANICRRRSKTWTGACPIITKNKPCDQQCREWEYAVNGGCHFQFPGFACFCYFNC